MTYLRRAPSAVPLLALMLALVTTVALTQQHFRNAGSAGVAFRQPVGRTGPLSRAERARERELGRLVRAARGATPSQSTLQSHGFVLVSGAASPFQLATNNGDVTMGTPYVYFDTTYFRYTAVAKYHWTCQCWENNVGGPDGFALRFSRSMDNRGVYGQFSGRAGLAYGTTIVKNPSDNSSWGVGYTLQDQWVALCCGKGTDYNMNSGDVEMIVGRPACGTTTQLYSSYWHTWSDSSITGFDIGSGSFGVSWTNQSHGWKASSQAGTWKVTC